MAELTVSFDYVVGTARFGHEVEVDQDKWDEMDSTERLELLRDAAVEDVDNHLDVEEDSINDNND